MKIRLGSFNRYLVFGLLTLILAAACETTNYKKTGEKKKGKEASTLRLHLEVNPDGTDRNGPVPVFREQPVMVNVHKQFFLNEGDVQEASVVEAMGGFALMIQFDQHGMLVLDTVSSSSKGSRIAIFSQFGSARWLAAPRITRRISDGVLTFTPDASREETERIARGLNNIAKEFKKKSKILELFELFVVFDAVKPALALLIQRRWWSALTLTLFPGRGTHGRPRWKNPHAGVGSRNMRKHLPLPGSPGGEGRGEGEPCFSLKNHGSVPQVFLLCSQVLSASAQSFQLPTANQALFEPNGGERFFVGTVGKPWTNGMFGCVRSDGWQMHEGLDIKCLQRDRRGEPVDPITAAADGTVAYFSTKAALSNYGKYIVLRHRIEGIDVYTLYAHLSEVRSDLRVGHPVKAGESIAMMGRTTNTRQGISKERAHVHFEIDLLVNERFPAWFQNSFAGDRNDHGEWNGRNLLGLDPRLVLLAQHEQGPNFSLLRFIRNQTELCRLAVRDTNFPWLRRYTPLIKRNGVAEREGIAGYEIALNYNGLPYQLIPRAASELTSNARIRLLSVNEAEQQSHSCRKLVIKRGAHWELTSAGQHLIGLLTH